MNSSSKPRAINGNFQPNKGKTDEWLTPPGIVMALGPFDLDPCSPIKRPWDTAKTHYTIEDNGLDQDWKKAFVWVNPPYSQMSEWLSRMTDHKNGIAFIYARTDTEWFFDFVWDYADSLLFLRQRPHFHYPDGSKAKSNSGGPMVLVGYGETATERLAKCKLRGKFIVLNNR